ncbi:MAG: glycosyltransferase family 2 protein [Bryobacteraceae bacterium]
MGRSRFSVVTVVLNDREGFCRTRSSVLAQGVSLFEWIVIDGGSTDGTLLEIEGTVARNIKWVSEHDKGLYDAMNKGLGQSTGDYIIFMNAGDSFAGPDVLNRVNILLLQGKNLYEPDILFGDAFEVSDTGGRRLLKKARPVRSAAYGMFTHHQAIFYRRKTIGSLRYDTSWRVAGDYAFTCGVLAKSRRTLKADVAICNFYRGGLSMKKAAIGRKEALMVQKSILQLGSFRRFINHAAFLASYLLKQQCPTLYDRIRFTDCRL